MPARAAGQPASSRAAPGPAPASAARAERGDGQASHAGDHERSSAAGAGLQGEGAGPERVPAIIPPRWVPLTSSLLCLLGLADASYLLYLHFTTQVPAFCPTKASGLVDCGAVLTSTYSHPFGVPVVIPGVAWAAAMLVVCSPWAWRAASKWWVRGRIIGAAAGMLAVFYLLWAELIKLHHLCEYCTGVHIVTFVLFLVVVFGTALALPGGIAADDEDA